MCTTDPAEVTNKAHPVHGFTSPFIVSLSEHIPCVNIQMKWFSLLIAGAQCIVVNMAALFNNAPKAHCDKQLYFNND